MINARVMIMTDNYEAGQIWVHGLQLRGISATVAQSSEDPLTEWGRDAYDLAIVDLYSAQRDAVRICQGLRAEITNPILLLSEYRGEPELLQAYAAGVDEYVVKPVSPLLFLAKVQAWLRRSWTVPTAALDTIQTAKAQLDPASRQWLNVDGSAVKLTNLEFRLLHLLMRHQGRALEGQLIIDRVWGYAGSSDTTPLKNVVYRLRRKLEPEPQRPRYLVTIPGEGYMFRAGSD